jgi:phosphatidylglycerophosphate synthase
VTVSDATERRPIAARYWRVSQAAAHRLARCGISANAISIAGMVCGVAAGLLLALTSISLSGGWLLWLVAALLIQLRLIANMLDGMVAIESATASRLGELYNEVPDRVSDTAILVGLGYAGGSNVALGYAAALAALLTAYIRSIGKGAGVGQEFCGPMAKQQRMFLATLAALYGAIVSPAFAGNFPINPIVAIEVLIVIGGIATAIRRLRRIIAALDGTP